MHTPSNKPHPRPEDNYATTMIMLPEEEWLNLTAMFEQLVDLITRRNADDLSNVWLESEEARRLLGVSPKTWQNYRDQRLIPFSQIGRKIYVNRTDLDTFIHNHRVMDGLHPAVEHYRHHKLYRKSLINHPDKSLAIGYVSKHIRLPCHGFLLPL